MRAWLSGPYHTQVTVTSADISSSVRSAGSSFRGVEEGGLKQKSPSESSSSGDGLVLMTLGFSWPPECQREECSPIQQTSIAYILPVTSSVTLGDLFSISPLGFLGCAVVLLGLERPAF